MIRTAFIIIGLLWLAKRVQHARDVQGTVSEMVPTNPYSSVTWQWDALNGTNLGAGDNNPHPAFYTLNVGAQDPSISNPCMCK